MKKIFTNIWNFFVSMAEAKYAADLARNGKHAEAQSIYKD
jgi:hypothetical protein